MCLGPYSHSGFNSFPLKYKCVFSSVTPSTLLSTSLTLPVYITVKDNGRSLSVPSIFLFYNHCSTTIILSYFLYLPLFLIFLCNILLYLVLRFQIIQSPGLNFAAGDSVCFITREALKLTASLFICFYVTTVSLSHTCWCRVLRMIRE
jgi:hypothetical protein